MGPGKLTGQQIRIAVGEVKPGLMSCAWKAGYGSDHKVALVFNIAGPTGQVVELSVVEDDVADKFIECLRDAIEPLVFPTFEAPNMTFTYIVKPK